MQLTGRRFLVTGASSGIGRATAVLLSRLGARLACTDIDQPGLDETAKLLQGDGHVSLVHDLRDLPAISVWVSGLAESFGKLHGFVHAAGVPAPWPLRTLYPELWRNVLLINTEAALALTLAFQRRSVYSGENGSIVFISSIMAQVGSPATTAYSMSKAALDGMARSMAMELAPRKIRVNCVAPAFVRTLMLDRVGALWDSGQKARIEASHPLGLGLPEDVSNAVAFLLADTARWITGTVLVVDGGYTAQ